MNAAVLPAQTVVESVALHPFLFVGCWNNRGAPRDIVATLINMSKVKNLVLAGDNVYPLSGTKTHSANIFHEGMALFKDKRIFGVLGNHNVKNAHVKEAEMAYEGWTLPSNYYARIFADNYAIVVLDTNIVEDAAKLAEMAAWLDSVLAFLRGSGIKYYAVQHEPFSSYKKKKRPVLVGAAGILRSLAVYPPEAILCADTHNFQINDIDVDGVKLVQYVSGTGGAEFDIIEGSLDPITIADGITLTIRKHVRGYGFLEVRPRNIYFEHVTHWTRENANPARLRHTVSRTGAGRHATRRATRGKGSRRR